LIAEDNDDTRSLIVSQLSHDYAVIESVNGRDALSKAQFQIPDLVISDVMMPDMDGYELSRSLKQDERTSHIPIILLTALADRDDKIEGLQTGADDYLIKPFDAKELSVRIRNLIENRKKMRETFSRSSVFPQLLTAGSSIDQQFISKAIATVHKHLSDESFEMEEFSKDMFLSRAQLHRKLKALSDLSATEFIRRTRLHYAKELLEKNVGTIAEIADKVGFSNHSYFAKCFKEQFGHLPSEKG
jgi:YesN/AraC family two-component response regulator